MISNTRAALLWLLAFMVPPFSYASPVKTEAVTGKNGQACVQYRYQYRDLAEQRRSELVFEALDEHQGKTIRKIQFESRAIFDESNPAEDNWLYRGFNRLHINTRESVLATQLLFNEGEPLRERLVEESERILRGRNYLTSAYIVPAMACPDYIDLLVVTRDAWVTEPEITFTREGGETESGFGLKDGNFLGTGDAISVSYANDVERSLVSYEYKTNHLFRTRWATRLYYAQKSDGEDTAFSLERPFYSLETPWATGIVTENISEIRVIREGGEDINEFRHRDRNREVYFGLAARADERFTRRWRMGVTRESDLFSPTDLTELGVPEDRKGNYIWLGMEGIENRFATYKNLNQIQRTEDVAMGVNYRFRVGYGGERLGNERDLIRYRGSYSNVIGVGEHHILQLHGEFDGRHYKAPNPVDSGVLGLEVNYNWFRDDQNRWYLRLRYDIGENLQQYEQLTVGGANGLRGYPIDYQRGDRRYVLNIERRYFSDLHLFNIVRMGGVAFFDVGRSWGTQIDDESNPHLANVGIGLRFSSSKTKVGNVLHVDLAAPLSDQAGLDSTQILIKAESSF
ncbi:BamA/TamA family outer membrane protein [Marinimicrobium agarilyticum]|uniref:BamA/TamA family outer membrane protein n=1 Tax=Marinimicrobium agarilyticum TaxID=306546 RepID=UPI0003FD27D3|nr:BamA/TamA family outer membrane protein [Marinimicrobium agarilyticum]